MKQSRILYLCLFIAALVFAYFNGGKIPYMLLYIIVLLPVISMIFTLIIYLRFKYDQELDFKLVTKGDSIHFIFNLHNEDFFIYPYINVTFHGSKTIFDDQLQNKNFSLLPFRKKRFSIELQCNYRGLYQIGINSIEFEDFFGLFALKYHVPDAKYVMVYPKIVYLDRFLLKTDFTSESHSMLNNKSEDMSTVSDVKKYAYGDSLKRIHWKLTAKSPDIMVKKFQGTSETSTIMLLDLYKSPYTLEENLIIEDKVIESVVAVLYFCLYNWVPVNLIFFSGKCMDFQAKNHLMFNMLVEILAKVTFKESIPVQDLLKIYTNNTLTKSNILIFTSNLNYELYNQIYKTSNSGFDVSIVYTSPEKFSGEKNIDVENILTSLPEIGVASYRINIDDNIKDVLEC